jgi:hypothetical protein
LTAFNVTVMCRAEELAPTCNVSVRCPDEQLRVVGSPVRCGLLLTVHLSACLTVACSCTAPPEWLTECGESDSAVTFVADEDVGWALDGPAATARTSAVSTIGADINPAVAVRPRTAAHRVKQCVTLLRTVIPYGPLLADSARVCSVSAVLRPVSHHSAMR